MRNTNQSGFTLIELLAVMVILGILAAAAVPQFIDLTDEAEAASVKGMAGAIESASNLNHAVNLAVDAGLSTDTVIRTRNRPCQRASQDLTVSVIDTGATGFAITGAANVSTTEGEASLCTITKGSGTANFMIISAQ